MISDEFKPNSAAVTLGFLIRKGFINPDESKEIILCIAFTYKLKHLIFL